MQGRPGRKDQGLQKEWSPINWRNGACDKLLQQQQGTNTWSRSVRDAVIFKLHHGKLTQQDLRDVSVGNFVSEDWIQGDANWKTVFETEAPEVPLQERSFTN